MKKILAMVVCGMVVLTASAQRANSGDSFKSKAKDVAGSAQFGIRAGMNVSNMTYKDEGFSEKGSAHVGYHLGFIVDAPVFRDNLYIQPGLYLTQKGYRENDGDDKYKELPTYLDIPILISGRYTLGCAQLQLNFGPYFACGLFGDAKESMHSWKYSEKLFSSDGYDYKRFDAGLSIGAGVLLSHHYYIGFQCEIGMVDLYKDDDGESLKNRNCMITVGYNF